MKSNFSKLGMFFGLTLIHAQAFATTFTDMVFVNFGSQPFYIDIFEANGADVHASVPGSTNSSSGRDKPARIRDFKNAQKYCQNQGKRLPTPAEWMAAASNLGANVNYSLAGDVISDPRGTFIANIGGKSGGSFDPTDFANVGIDAIGTVGMTGNRPEWVDNGSGGTQCGGGYEDRDIKSAQLSRLCSISIASSATARCVVNGTSSDQVRYSPAVTGTLLAHLNTIGNGVVSAGTVATATTPSSTQDTTPTDTGTVQKQLGKAGDPKQAPPPEPKYDDVFSINKDLKPDDTDPNSRLIVLPANNYLVLYHEAVKFFKDKSLKVEPGVYVAARGAILNERKDLQNLVDGGVWLNPFGDMASITAGFAPGTVPSTQNEIWATQNNQYFQLQDNEGKSKAIMNGIPFKIFPTAEGAFFITKQKKFAFIPREVPADTDEIRPFGVPKLLQDSYVTLTRDGKNIIYLGEGNSKDTANILLLKTDGLVTVITSVKMLNGRPQVSMNSDGIFYPAKTKDAKDANSFDVVGLITLADDGSIANDNPKFHETRPQQKVEYMVDMPVIQSNQSKGGRLNLFVSTDGSVRNTPNGASKLSPLTKEDIDCLTNYGENWTAAANAGAFDTLVDRPDYVKEAVSLLKASKNTWVNINGGYGIGKSSVLRLIARYIALQASTKRDWVGYQIFHIPLSSIIDPKDAKEPEKAKEDCIKRIMAALNDKPVILMIDDFLDDPKLGSTNVSKAMGFFLTSFRGPIAAGRVKVVTSSDNRHWSEAVAGNSSVNQTSNTITLQPPSANELHLIVGSRIADLERRYKVRFDNACTDTIIYSAAEASPLANDPERSILIAEKIARQFANADANSKVIRPINQQDCRSIALGSQAQSQYDMDQLGPMLNSKIIGQEDAIAKIVDSTRQLSLGSINRRGPRAVLFLIGPTGTGKTSTANFLAEFLNQEVVRIDMSHFTGFGAGATYTQRIKALGDRDFILLLDDIDKAPSPSKVLTELRNVFDTGIYAEGTQDELPLRNAVIIATGNHASQLILDAKEESTEAVMAKVRNYVFDPKTPENEKIPRHVWSRIESGVVIFRGLSNESLTKIAQIYAKKISEDFKRKTNIELYFSQNLIENLVQKSAEQGLGAVPIQKRIETEVKEKLSIHLDAQAKKRVSGIKQILITLSESDQVILLDNINKGFKKIFDQGVLK